MPSHYFVDIHCHPSIKACARSFENTPGLQSASVKNYTYIRFTDPLSLFDSVKAVGLLAMIGSVILVHLQNMTKPLAHETNHYLQGWYLEPAGDH